MTSLKSFDKYQGRDSNLDYSISSPLSFLLPYKFWTQIVGGYFYFLLIHQHSGFAGYSAGIGVHYENDVKCQIQ